jgi:lipopolysaccharide/colanic/teichoic acid biosynthesis glycosyltransferase
MSARPATVLRVRPSPRRPARAVALPPRPLYDACAPVVHGLLALVALVIASPLFLALAVAVKATSRGPIFYRGARVGCRERPFRIYKFRTMVEGAERYIGGRLASDADKAAYCTRLGRLLKKAKLDELPQLFNVLRGEMRLVGPRPLRPVFLEPFKAEIPGYAARFLVPPGITGVAQLRGGYYTAPRDKLRYDLVYLRRRSLPIDLAVILLTFVKILNRWLGMGVVLVVLFLFVSLVPAGVHAALAVDLFGVRVSVVSLCIVLAAAWAALRRRSAGFSLYRCPLNVAIPLFALLGLATAAAAPDPRAALQGTGYYLATGLLLSFLIVNSLAARPFFTVTVRVVALTSVAVSLLGLVRLFLLNHGMPAFADTGAAADDPLRLSSVVGGPAVLAIYLVLGLPILLAEVTAAETRRARDFWLICTTVSFVGICFTQTRVGLLALLVSGGVFLYRRRRRAVAFIALFVVALLPMAIVVAPRLSPPRIAVEAGTRLDTTAATLQGVSARQWLIGGAAGLTRAAVEPADRERVPNMHLTFVLEHGVVAWLLLLWLIASVLRTMMRAHARIRDERMRRTLRAIGASLVGFLVSMNAMNTFHHLPLQVFFWSLIGIGLGIAIQLGGPRVHHNMIWRFGDAGD